MLRELNENEMEMVSGGSIDWQPTRFPGAEVWDVNDSEFAQGGSDGTFAQDTGGDAFGNATGVLRNVTPRQSDFNPANIGGGTPTHNWRNLGGDNFTSWIYQDRVTGWLWADVGNNGSIDGPARLINGNYWVDTDNNGSFDTNIGSGTYGTPTGQ